MPITQAIKLLRKLWNQGKGPETDSRGGVESAGSAGLTDFQLLAENSMDLILRVGPDMRSTYASPSSLHLLGWSPEEMVGKPVEELVLAEDIPAIEASVHRLHSGQAEQATTMVRLRKKNGELLWVEGNAHMIDSSDPGAAGDMVVIVRDITERKRLEDELAKQALTDGLTGLANRRAFDEALDREWRRTLREGTKISLLLLDLDHFKEFNDRYGHTVGDDCLRAVASAIRSVARRPGDVVARYGGEEIAVILYDTDLEGGEGVAEQIRQAILALRLPHAENPEGGGWVTASTGVATALAIVGGTIRMPESLLVAADGAMYRAKHGGRNRVAGALLLAPNEKP